MHYCFGLKGNVANDIIVQAFVVQNFVNDGFAIKPSTLERYHKLFYL